MLEECDIAWTHFMKSLSSSKWLNGKNPSTQGLQNHLPVDISFSKSLNNNPQQLWCISAWHEWHSITFECWPIYEPGHGCVCSSSTACFKMWPETDHFIQFPSARCSCKLNELGPLRVWFVWCKGMDWTVKAVWIHESTWLLFWAIKIHGFLVHLIMISDHTRLHWSTCFYIRN